MDQIQPVSAQNRNLGGPDMLLLWAGAAVSLAEIWAGGMLAPLGFGTGLLVIIAAHIIGGIPMSFGSVMGAQQGLPSMILTRSALGRSGSYLAAGLNVIQLVGWTAVMIWLGGHAAAAISKPFGESSVMVWIVVGGLGTTLWAALGHRHWKWVHRIAVSALLLMCLQMSYLVWIKYGPATWAAPKPGLGWGIGLDIVIAMPISWLPLVADYGRFSRSAKAAGWGTWWGYGIVSTWMFALGLSASLATGSATPEAMIMKLLADSGWVLAGLLIVVLSTFTTTFLDVYSTAVSAMNFPERIGGLKRPGQTGLILITGGLGTLVALGFSAHAYEPFLLYIGSFFCPLFGIVLTDYFLVRKASLDLVKMGPSGPAFRWQGIGAWLIGFLIYRAAINFGSPIGASLPAFIGAAAVYYGVSKAAEDQ